MLRLLILPFAIMAMLGLSGCEKSDSSSSSAGNEGRMTLELWHYFSNHQARALEDLLKKFEGEHPDIAVRAVYQGAPAQLKQKLDGSFASGTGTNPVISLVYESWVDDFLRHDYVEPVQNYFDGPEGLTQEEQDDFVKAFREGNSWNGEMVTLPFNKSIYMLYLNMDLMRAAGVTTAPATQQEFAEAVRKATVRRDRRTSSYGFGLMPKGEAFTTLLFARGGRLVNEQGQPTINSPEALEVLQLLKGLQYPEKNLYVNMDYMSVPFANRMIAMFLYSSASLPYNQSGSEGKFDYQAAAIPGVEGQAPRYLMQGTNIAIFANKPQAEKDAAWKLIRFLTTPENGAYFVTRSGYMPYRYSMLQQPELVKYMEEHPDYALASRLVLSDQGIQEPKVRVWEGIRSEFDTLVDSLMSREDSDPAKLLEELQRKAEAKMKTP